MKPWVTWEDLQGLSWGEGRKEMRGQKEGYSCRYQEEEYGQFSNTAIK